MPGLILPAERLLRMAAHVADELQDASVVVCAPASMGDTHKGRIKYQALIGAARQSREAGVTHLAVVNGKSSEALVHDLQAEGALPIVVDSEWSGLRPLQIGAAVVSHMCEPKTLFIAIQDGTVGMASSNTISTLREAAREHDVINGIRSAATLRSLPGYRAMIERVAANLVPVIANLSQDPLSGVLALNYAGRELLVESESDDTDLLTVLATARKRGFKSTGRIVDFRYDIHAVINEEGDPEAEAAWRQWLGRIVDRARIVGGPTLSSRQMAAYGVADRLIRGFNEMTHYA